MKVTIVVGGRFHAFDLARELQHEGLLHRLITTYPKFKTRHWDIPDNKVISLPLNLVLARAIQRVGGESWYFRFQALLHRVFATAAANYLSGSDIIHGYASDSEPSLLWAKERGVPFVLERPASHQLVQYNLLVEEYRRLGIRWVGTHGGVIAQELREYNLADRVQVPSLFVKRSFLALGYPAEKLVRNPLGVNITSFSPGAKHDNTFRVIYAGVLSVQKGVYYLARAFREADIPDSELCLVGKPTAETRMLLGPTDPRIRQVGHVPQAQLPELYRNASVFVMSSIQEGMAMVQIQALACGLPLICTTNTGGEDLLRMSGAEPMRRGGGVEEYPAGYVVPIRDPAAIAGLLRELADNPGLLSRKREAALNLREDQLSWLKYAERCIDVYESLVPPALQYAVAV